MLLLAPLRKYRFIKTENTLLLPGAYDVGTEKASLQKTRSLNNPDILNISDRRHLRVYKL